MKQEQKNDYKRQDLTEREKAVIIWGIVTGCKDWKKIYLLSRENPPDSYSEKNTATAASRFKLSAKVRDFVREQNAVFQAKADQIRNEAGTAGGIDPETDTDSNGETKPGKAATAKKIGIDFTETQNALQELNRLANEIQDPKARADAIQAIQKLIAQTRTDDETGPEIQRFYTSLRCQSCQLYKNAQQDSENGPK